MGREEDRAAEREMRRRANKGDGEARALLVFAMLQDSNNPPCSGPVAIHANAHFECPTCDSCRENYHDADSTFPCNHGVFAGIKLAGECGRCRVVLQAVKD